jgi:hypothetical protein
MDPHALARSTLEDADGETFPLPDALRRLYAVHDGLAVLTADELLCLCAESDSSAASILGCRGTRGIYDRIASLEAVKAAHSDKSRARQAAGWRIGFDDPDFLAVQDSGEGVLGFLRNGEFVKWDHEDQTYHTSWPTSPNGLFGFITDCFEFDPDSPENR